LLLHWPSSAVALSDQIGALNETVRAGKARYIGVSNFNRALLADAVRLSEVPFVTNQFEYHPYLDQRLLIAATLNAGLSVTAYCAMAVGRVFSDPMLKQIATERGKEVAQIVLRWLIQQNGVVALSRSTNIDRIASNVAIYDFELSAEEMTAIGKLAQPCSRIVDPPGLAPEWD
jgi:2,5-diketo-D-gluconate reductase B